ncbi:hypothetical protein BC938DRAFT_479144 [Jimgerdemannia flammicorona]|uniref:Uncharacterized protein n=1 Tax=Jimgerdemannia flammicorona TaxID=994334 RepID=A0A433QLG5_9FUNG|nr:hypothetical protein BC938DRAFT_479144 [Jimgerdemannia flammicorona]
MDVAQDFRFRVMRVKHLVGHVLGRARQRGRKRRRSLQRSGQGVQVRGLRPTCREHLEQVFEILLGDGLIEGDTDGACIDGAEINAEVESLVEDVAGGATADVDGKSVEEMVVLDRVAQLADPGGEDGSQVVDTLSNGPDALWTVVDAGLGRADVAGCLLPADVLLAGLERQPERGLARGILGHTDETARHATLVLVLDGEEGGMRTTVAKRDTEALAVAQGNIGTKFARRLEHRQREEIGRDDDLASVTVDLGGQGLVVDDGPISAGILQNTRKDVRGRAIESLADPISTTKHPYSPESICHIDPYDAPQNQSSSRLPQRR